MLLLNVILVFCLAISTAFGARFTFDDDRRLGCDELPGFLCKGIQDSQKIRRAGTVGLFPFPRVGRSQPERTWMLSPQEYSEMHHEAKRQGLIPFPRVGRAMYDQYGGKRSNGDANGGMWFGPRLGRVSKKNILGYQDDPWTMFAFRELSPPRDFTPRLGRESEEDLNDDQIEQPDQSEQEIVRQKREAQ